MIIHRVISDLIHSNMYLIIEGNGAIVIDPCRNTKMPKGISPELIFLTHEHYDHISGVNAWKEKYKTKVLCSSICNERMQSAKKNMARYFEAFCGLQNGLDNTVPGDYDPEYCCQADEVFSEDKIFLWRGHSIKLMTLPGHSPGSAGIYMDGSFFSGDSLFEHLDTVLRFPGGSEKDWREVSLPKIRTLSPLTIVYPGHFDSFVLDKWKLYKEETNGAFYE